MWDLQRPCKRWLQPGEPPTKLHTGSWDARDLAATCARVSKSSTPTFEHILLKCHALKWPQRSSPLARMVSLWLTEMPGGLVYARLHPSQPAAGWTEPEQQEARCSRSGRWLSVGSEGGVQLCSHPQQSYLSADTHRAEVASYRG